jgi:hypothetical protein
MFAYMVLRTLILIVVTLCEKVVYQSLGTAAFTNQPSLGLWHVKQHILGMKAAVVGQLESNWIYA